MNELLINRLKSARTDSGLKQQDVALQLGIKANTISNWEKGRTEPDIDTFVKLCKIYEIDCASLLSDVYAFPKMKSDISRSEHDHILKYRRLDSPGREIVDAVLEKESLRIEKYGRLTEKTSADPVRLISYYYKNASAGTGQLVIDNLPEKDIEIPDIPKYRNVSYAIGVNGSSMEPTYHDGDILLVEATQELQIGEIGIFQIEDEAFVKKLGASELISLNEEYNNIPLDESARTLGRVIDKLQISHSKP